MANTKIVFGTDIAVDKAFIHSDESFQVQWNALNVGEVDAPAFTDLLVITSIPEGCPGSDGQDHPVVFDSDRDASPLSEAPLPAQKLGDLKTATVGPFPTGSYRLTVTLANDLDTPFTSFLCIDILDPI